MRVDLAIRNGTVVTPSTHAVTDIGIRDGVIVQLGGELRADDEVDASGKLVFPGGIDMHVHLTPVEIGGGVIEWADDFASGSAAAAAGGITTIGNMTFPRPDEALHDALARALTAAEGTSLVDFVLHPVLLDPSPEAIAAIPGLVRDGHSSLKIFMIAGDFDARAGDYLRALHAAGRAGALTLFHCEDNCVIGFLCEQLLAAGKGGPAFYPDSRPVYSEAVAAARAIAFAEAAAAPIYIVHLSSAEALEVCHKARARGLPVYVETRPLYLYLTRERFAEPDGAKYVGNPPLREPSDVTALWHGLAGGDIHTFCTDHAPWNLAAKLDPSLNVATFRPGMSDLQTLLPLLFSAGVRGGKLSLRRFVEVTSTNAARLFGLFPRKGTVAVGSDADLVIWDPELTRTVSAADDLSCADFSLYEGWEVTGWPTHTYLRGRLIAHDGAIVAEQAAGRWVPRLPHAGL
jgi:dihydropyrimidinase